MTLSTKRAGAGREQSSPSTTTERRGNVSVLEIIRDADLGQIVEDANDKIATITEALVDNHDRTGKVTIEIKFKSLNGVIETMTDVKHTLTGPKRLASRLFVGEDGTVGRRDPRQPLHPAVVTADELNRRRGGHSEEDK